MRTSFSIAGTDTGRLSSSRSAFYSGTNFQNIDPRLRRMFEADAGYKIGYIDLEQAEARAVGALIWNVFHDGKYLDFCESGDLHTNVAKMTWKNLGWTGDSTHDKLLAKTKFYRDFSYRDASKRVGHASNYFGKPPHISKEVRIPVGLVQEFQRGYFGAFPSISEWHNWVRTQLLKKGFITTFMGRQRWFHGRLWDDTTLRAAIAYEPQSAIADYLNTGLLRVWKSNKVQLLAQIHDAILFQYPEHLENEVIPFVQKTLSIEIPLFHNRSFSIPTEAFVGWNWGYAFNDKKEMVNPDGLVLFSCNDKRSRTKETSLMDRRFRGVY